MLVILLLWIVSALSFGLQCAGISNRSLVENPLVYTRLRHDYEYLQLYRNLQLREAHQETAIKLELNSNISRPLVTAYYEDDRIDADLITQDDLVLEALERTYMTRYINTFVYNFDDPEDRRKASDQRLVSATRCARELKYLEEKLSSSSAPGKRPHSPELAAFFDSYAKEEPGLLFGNWYWTGNWRQCSKRLIFDLDRANASNSINFQGRYCIASIRSDRWETKIQQRANQHIKIFFKSANQQYDYKRFFRIQVGICLPESCDSTTINNGEMAELIRKLAVNKLNEPYRSYKLADLFCLPDETSELRKLDLSGWLFVLMALIWCSSIIVATLIDFYQLDRVKTTCSKEKGIQERLIASMSLRRNLANLFATKSYSESGNKTVTNENSDNGNVEKMHKMVENSALENKATLDKLDFLSFFKAFCMPMVLLGHVAMLSGISLRFPLDFSEFDSGPLFHYYLNSIFLIDWFFMMAAFITVYVVFVSKKRVDRIPIGHWLYSVFHRYWRLAPLYVIVFWFCRSVFQFTGKGPVWDYGTTNMTIRGVCKSESWIWPIALVSNLHPFHEECIVPSWFISMSMQFYLITPPILVCLAKWPKSTWTALIVAIISGIAIRAYRFIVDPHAQAVSLAYPRCDAHTRVMYDMYPTYLYPHYRLPSYLIGLLAGHYCYMVLAGKWRSRLFTPADMRNSNTGVMTHNYGGPSKTRSIVWFAGFFMLILMSFCSWFMARLTPISWEPYARSLTAFTYGICHVIDASAFAFLLVAFMFGQFSRLKLFLSHPVWAVLSRINVSLLLIHSELMNRIHQSANRVIDSDRLDMVRDWFLILFLCYPMAVLGTLFLEMPLAKLERQFLGRHLSPGRPPATQKSPPNTQSENEFTTVVDTAANNKTISTMLLSDNQKQSDAT